LLDLQLYDVTTFFLKVQLFFHHDRDCQVGNFPLVHFRFSSDEVNFILYYFKELKLIFI